MIARNSPGRTVPLTLSIMILDLVIAPLGLQRPVGGTALMVMSSQDIWMSCFSRPVPTYSIC